MMKVENDKEKQITYKVEYKKFKLALKEEYYLEAMTIGYAIIEDRLVSFLHHAGIVSRQKDNLKITRSSYPYIRLLINKNEDYSIKIKDISIKIKLIRELICLTLEAAEEIDCKVDQMLQQKNKKYSIAKPGYMLSLAKQLNQVSNIDIFKILDQLDIWRKKRNRLAHGLMSHKNDVLIQVQHECAEEAYDLARKIDIYLVKPFKIDNEIRKRYNIQ